MRDWSAERLAQACAGRLLAGAAAPGGPARVTIDSRDVRPGDLFVGLRGRHHDGGAFARAALAAGAWGVIAGPEHAHAAQGAPGAFVEAEDPLAALQSAAREWRRELGAAVVAVTGSTGKTSTKELLAAMAGPHRRTFASPENRNTEIGLPLAILEAPAGTELLVLELAMRGAGQIAELVAVCEPDVGVIVNVGPAHLELLGSLEAIAAAKAELIRDIRAGADIIVPADEPLLRPHLRDDVRITTFGPGGDVELQAADDGGRVVIAAGGERIELELGFTQAHHRSNALACVAACRALGFAPSGRVDADFGAMRGERMDLPGEVGVIVDCYNANPMSMRAALDDLAVSARGRRVAVLGDMLELGAQAPEFHREVGAHARERGIDLLVAVGAHAGDLADGFGGRVKTAPDAAGAARLVPALLEPGDTVLLKASRGVGLEAVADALAGREDGG